MKSEPAEPRWSRTVDHAPMPTSTAHPVSGYLTQNPPVDLNIEAHECLTDAEAETAPAAHQSADEYNPMGTMGRDTCAACTN